MNICEGCIKQDICKFKDEVGKYEGKMKLPEPLSPIIECKYKETERGSCPYTHFYWPYYWYPPVSIPSVWTDSETTTDPTWTTTSWPSSDYTYTSADNMTSN